MRSIEPFKHGTLALVAAAYAALSFADGGYSQRLTAAATIAIWLAVAVGIVARAWPRWPISRVAIAAGGCLAGLGLLTALSMIWADDAGRAFAAFVRIGGYLGLFALVVLSVPRSGARAWLAGLAVGLTVVCVASLGTRFDPSLFGGGDRELGLALPSARGRLSYPIGYWNGLAACLAIQAVLLAWLGACATTRLRRAAAIGLLPLPALALYLTSSRGGFAAALVGGLVLLAFEREKAPLLAGIALGAAGGGLLVLFAHPRGDFLDGLATSTAKHEGLEVGVASLLCVLAVGLARYLLDDRLTRVRVRRVPWRVAAPVLIAGALLAAVAVNPEARVNEFASPTNASSSEPGEGHLLSAAGSNRYQYWDAAVSAFASRPFTGIGAGNYALYWNTHPEVALPVLNAHSLYVETLAELGVVGLGLVLGFFAAAGLAGWQRRNAASGGEVAAALAVLSAGVLTAGLEWTWQLPAAFVPVVAAAGVLTAVASEGRAAAPAPAGAKFQSRFGLGIATIGIAWASIWAAGILLVTEAKLNSSRAAAARGDLAQAANDADDAASVEPWSPEPRLQLALVEELGGDLRAARSAAGEAIDRAPGDWRPWAVAARIDTRGGDFPAAHREIIEANALNPVALPAEFVAPLRRHDREERRKARR